MTNRISTAGFYYGALNALLDAQSQLAKTQSQVASGKRILTPADDPVGATRMQDLLQQLSGNEQYARNIVSARNRLSLEDQTLTDVGDELNRIRELTVQASNDTLDVNSRRMIQTEISGRLAALVDVANRRDAQGEYLFAGLASSTQPFARGPAGVTYQGDQGQRLQQISDTQRVADGDSGFDVFQRIGEGNGTFVTAAAPTNTGTGSIGVGSVTDRAAWSGGNFTLQFVSGSNWQVVDGTLPVPNVLAAGAYVSGQAISFNGIQFAVNGQPAAGDQFTVRPAGNTDLFSTLDRLVATLGTNTDDPVARAQFRTALDGSLAQLDRSLDHILDVRARVGTRLNTIETAESAQQDTDLTLQSLLSDVRDLDYAEAVTRLAQQSAGLQAAQQSLAKVGQLSLFDYLR
jgi:flagellar hook-associated protein 3 FlgL